MVTSEFQVSGMTCAHCAVSVREEVGRVVGVQEVQVSVETGTLVVTSRHPVEDAAVVSAVQEAGYEAVRDR